MTEPVYSETVIEVPFSKRQLWPILCKTDWINRAVGLPPVDYEITKRPEGGSSVIANARVMGAKLRWQEMPFEWVEGEFYYVQRIFETGPFIEARMGLKFEEISLTQTRIRSFIDAKPRHAFGAWFARRILGPKAGFDMKRLVAELVPHLQGENSHPMPRLQKTPVAEDALKAGLEKLREFGEPAELVTDLEKFLHDSSDVELAHIRPLAIAKSWQKDSWEVLGLFLEATRAGLLDLSWEVLCPNCRSTRQPLTRRLAEVRREMHCEVCQIRYDAKFDRTVELKFSVNSAVRPRVDQTFCIGGPGGRPHIVSQLVLQPGERRAWKLPLIGSSLRLRSPQIKTELTLTPGFLTGNEITCEVKGFEQKQSSSAAAADNKTDLTVVNPNNFIVQLILERVEWDQDILTAAVVTNWQDFRDLFTSEVMSPQEQIVVGQQVLLFTDLRGSTALYCAVGDAPAYALVRDHFQILLKAVRSHHGTVVKTIGDAVMAVFSNLTDALAAVHKMHRSLAVSNRHLEFDTQEFVRHVQETLALAKATGPAVPPSLILKSSLNIGPCLAVNANDRLDYFGTSVNFAARLVNVCEGGDLAVPEEVFERPETARLIEMHKLPVKKTEAQFRGFDDPVPVWQIKMT